MRHSLACLLLASFPYMAYADGQNTLPQDTLRPSRQLNELIVTGTGGGKDRMGHISVSGAEINRRPALLGEHDLIKALQTTPGVVAGTEGFAGLYVRGGETDQNLYLLDGLPLLNVYHFGGLFSTFGPGSVDRVDFYKGAFPTPFGARASSIVDVALKKPDLEKFTGSASAGLISGQLYLSTPLRKGNSAISVALRRTWFDLFSIPALAIINATKKDDGRKTVFNYGFTDLSVKLTATDRRRNNLSLMFFYGKDNFKLGESRFDPNHSDNVYQKDINRLSWGNWGFAADYSLSCAAGVLRLRPFVSKAFATDSQENMDNNGNSGSLTAVTRVKSAVLQAGMTESFLFPLGEYLDGEAGMQQTWHDYRIGNPTVDYSGISAGNMSPRFPDHSRNGLLSGFAELHWNVAGAVHGSAGIRADRYLSPEAAHWELQPRINIKAELPHRASISAGYSRMTQYAQQISSNYMYLPSDAWLPTATYHKPLVCDIYSLGFFKKTRGNLNVKAELWWKEMQGLADYRPNMSAATTTLPWYAKTTFGKGRAYGLDLEIDGSFRSVAWSVAYGLMWNRRRFPELNGGRSFPAKFDNRHKIDLNVCWNINERMELTGNWEYMTGNRATIALYNTAPPDIAFPDSPFLSPLDPGGDRQDGIDYYRDRNNVRLPAFHRLNLNLSVKGRLSRRVTYRWDFSLYNAYCRMNPFSVVKRYINDWNDDTGSYRKFKTLSLLPILPSVSYTINF